MKMTLRAPICEGSYESLLSPESKLLDNLFHSFFIAFKWVYVTPLCCYLLYSQNKISLISPSLSRQGNSGSLSYLWLTVQGLKGKGLCMGKITFNICGIFFHCLNSLTYFRIISQPLCASLGSSF